MMTLKDFWIRSASRDSQTVLPCFLRITLLTHRYYIAFLLKNHLRKVLEMIKLLNLEKNTSLVVFVRDP